MRKLINCYFLRRNLIEEMEKKRNGKVVIFIYLKLYCTFDYFPPSEDIAL